MIIKKIKLNNIRSYKNQEIEFPSGSILLSGNIGSGKSTILLAVDFALFGITRDLPGSAILRNGEDTGSVELNFTIDDKDIILKRNLKRSQSSVIQDAGYITINNTRQDMTATELKQKVLEILNYPQDLLTKSKSVIYNYTVYSPQEKMKEILLSKKEERLEILRRIFGIDKYKRIRNNSEIFTSLLKQKSKEIAIMISDLEQKSEELAEMKERHNELDSYIFEIDPQIKSIKEGINEKKKSIEFLETQLKESKEIKNEIDKTGIFLKHNIMECERLKKDLETINCEINILENEISKLPMPDPSLKERIKIIEGEISRLENQNLHTEKKKSELETIKKSHEKLCNDIGSMEECPICRQVVIEKHKDEIIREESKKIEKISLDLQAISRSLRENSETLISRKAEIKQKESSIISQEIISIKQSEFEKKKNMLEKIKVRLDEIKKEIALLSSKKIDLESRYKENPLLEKEIVLKKIDLESTAQNLRELEIKEASLKAESRALLQLISNLEKEVERKNKSKINVAKLLQIREWIEKQFINLTVTIEKSIMLRVHSELESLIQKWFLSLVDSETIKIRLDEEFTPIIEQNGHEIDYVHLSGGEKTAAALSYRLALNQVINTLMSSINTKDILMLDEPTDGFSQEQLEKMRNILEDLNTKQTIIVSHDPKVESFVDRVIHLEKSEHITRISNT
ncbi:MAG: AAA family ATPase [Nanoarchaeota archaeon]|nr:AAA family ATPase [Nanoarchaeota archaeon]